MCQKCPKRETCAAPCVKFIATQAWVLARRKARETVAEPVQKDAVESQRRFDKPLAAILLSLALVAADSIADPSTADNRIGDGPDDIITAEVYECVTPTGSLSYHVKDAPTSATTLCWRADIERPYVSADP